MYSSVLPYVEYIALRLNSRVNLHLVAYFKYMDCYETLSGNVIVRADGGYIH